MTSRRNGAHRLEPTMAKRQFEVTGLAIQLLGTEGALRFMNRENASLGGRPIDLAIASDEGRKRVEEALSRLSPIGQP